MGNAGDNGTCAGTIVVLVDDANVRARFADVLGATYAIVDGTPREMLAREFDVCIVDISNLNRYERLLGGRRAQEGPVLLPVLAVVSPQEIQLLTQHIGDTVDDLIATPIAEPAVRARVSSLIRTRRLSREADRLSRMTGERAQTHLRLAVEAANVGLWDWDLRTGEVFFSSQWKKQIGYENHEIPDEYGEWEKRLHPDDSARVLRKVYDFARRPRPPIQFEYRLRHRDGTYRWILARATLIVGKDGRAARMLGVHLDITERKRTEEAVVEERNLANAIIDSMPGVFYLFDLDQRFVRWNRSFQSVSGYSGEEMKQLRVLDMFCGADREKIAGRIRQAVESGQAEAEAALVTKDGRSIPLYFTGRLIELEGRQCIIGMGIDIVERKKAEERVIEERNLSNMIVDSLPGVFYLYDEQGWFLRWNKNLEAVTGYSEEDMRHQNVRDMFDEATVEMVMERVREVFRVGRSEVEAPILTKAGRRLPYFLTGKRIEYDGRPCLIGMGLDITKRKLAEEGLKASLRDKEILLQELYHRTKNNMQVISALLELQAVSSTSDETKRLVADSQLRIRAMALAHDKLYRSRSLSRIDMREYLAELTRMIMAGRNVSAEYTEPELDIGEISLLIDVAIPCGLIVNELLSGVLESVLPHDQRPRIYISLRREGTNQIELTVGYTHLDVAREPPPDAKLVSQIVRHQLHGSLSAESNGRTAWHIRFRDDLYTERVSV